MTVEIIEINDAYRIINILAVIGAFLGYRGLIILEFRRDCKWPLRQTIPLLASSTILALIGTGLWFSGPVPALLVRAAIVLCGLVTVVVLLRPLYILRTS